MTYGCSGTSLRNRCVASSRSIALDATAIVNSSQSVPSAQGSMLLIGIAFDAP